jgi:5-(aminomethyl)-3-furanmethanol phosphate kinase
VSSSLAVPDAVVKIGGSLLTLDLALSRAIGALELIARTRALLIVPGGGPFADIVRTMDDRYSLGDDAAHWMAILAMEQYAELLATRISDAALVHDASGMRLAHERGQIPVLAPYRWLRDADPLPHSWDVTSDSIAAWIANAVGASRLILIKPPAHDPRTAVDRYFEKARAPGLKCMILTPDALSGNWFPE